MELRVSMSLYKGLRAKDSNFPNLPLAQSCSAGPSEIHLQSKGMDF